MDQPIYPIGVLTVVIRDDGPLVDCGDVPSYRSVRIDLTPEQVERLALRHTHSIGSSRYHEVVSRCFIEPGTFKKGE
jgi:hypothetical protein